MLIVVFDMVMNAGLVFYAIFGIFALVASKKGFRIVSGHDKNKIKSSHEHLKFQITIR